ncbi:TrmH family RNA methyltransferase [Neolewinella persica]|uniref:TrmH family RNA methyltransferase n=1 Tax=Neolewinella persica TaxID=70998 RepID=UPI00035D2F86|nr:TrmH family RNA methyltransferase [Neolewinella persica]
MRQLKHHEVKTTGKQYPIWLLCPDWRDPRNVGSAFRLAEAAGLAGLVLTGSTPRPPHAKIEKTARSTVRSVPHMFTNDVTTYLRSKVAEGAYVLALEITDESTSLLEFQLPAAVSSGQRELILIAGAEDHGVSQEILALCAASAHLPMHGVNTSMNVAVALGAGVYLLLSQYQEA